MNGFVVALRFDLDDLLDVSLESMSEHRTGTVRMADDGKISFRIRISLFKGIFFRFSHIF